MTCPCCGCGCEPPAGSSFCNGCGGRLEVTCPSCGITPPAGSKFCNGCGGPLGASPCPADPPARAPADYTPKHLADKILQSKSALEGERKQVTVMFADVKGSMELAEQLDPEEWHRILERFLEILTDGVHRFEGTVNQYTGDGIMALFGDIAASPSPRAAVPARAFGAELPGGGQTATRSAPQPVPPLW